MRLTFAITAAFFACTLAACSMPLHAPTPAPAVAAQLSRMVYPANAPLGEDLDIVAVRNGQFIELVNRTPRKYHNCELWLNQQYVGLVKEINIGHNPRLDLVNFVNRFGEAYPTGSLLQPEASYPIVLGELHDPAAGKKYRIVVRLGKSDNQSVPSY